MDHRAAEIDAVIEGARRIAIVGASPDPTRPSNGVCQVLIDAGFEVIPVNPNADVVCGLDAVDRLEDIDGVIDVVDVFRRSEHAPGIAREAVAAGARALWLQVGVRSDEAARIATDAGLRFVQDACLAVAVDRARHTHAGS